MNSYHVMGLGSLLFILSFSPAHQALAEQAKTGGQADSANSAVPAGEGMPLATIPVEQHGDRLAAGHRDSPESQAHEHGAASNAPGTSKARITQAASRPKSPNHYVVTLVDKDATHPFYGIGDKQGFAINGVQGAELVMERGKTYFLEVKSSPMHDVYLSGDKLGWGALVIETGVKGNFIYEGEIEFTPDENTPDIIFYQCQNHKAMGGRIFIVNSGEGRDISKLIAKHGKLRDDDVSSAGRNDVSSDEVNKKLSYAKMVAMSKPAKRVKQSGHEQANDLLQEALGMLDQARIKQEAGDSREALALVDEALRKMSAASQMVPSDDVVGEQRQRYQDMLNTLNDNRKSHQAAAQRMQRSDGEASVVSYDKAEVEALVKKAENGAAGSKYSEAIASLQEADRLVTAALNEMLKSQTVVYQLNLDTPEGEYQYELDRYHGYVDLVPLALDDKQPNQSMKSLFDGYVSKGNESHAKALEFAAKGKYPEAIRLLQDATKDVQRGLRMLGVKE